MDTDGTGQQWSRQTLSVWAKTSPVDQTSMSLVRHLEDAMAVGALLWDHWLPGAIKDRIARDLPGGEDDARALYLFLCAAHDVGKADISFALKARNVGMDELVAAMCAAGLPTPAVRPPNRQHWTVGLVATRDWARARFAMPARRSMALFSAVGAHHGVAPDNTELVAVVEGLKAHEDGPDGIPWRESREEILDVMAARSGLAERLAAWGSVALTAPAQALLTGAVVVADWLASDSARFPYADPRTSKERADAALIEWDLPPAWTQAHLDDDPDEAFRERFNRPRGTARPVQRAAVGAARSTTGPPLVVIEAGTGEGKTEAALMAAEVLAERFGCGGVMVALPTQATSDSMFGRFRAWVDAVPGPERRSIFLAHGKAALNDEFRGLIRGGAVQGVEDECHVEQESRAVVTSWLRGRRKGVLANFVVGTIDQVLFGALGARHLPLRQLALAGKVVVIDEVHAADEYMQVYLRRVLEWLGALGTPVVLLSATLPPHMRDALTAAYAAGAGVLAPASAHDDTYPRITVVDHQPVAVAVAPGGHVERSVAVEVVDDDMADAEVLRALEAGACVAVICNTVGRAQETYHRLSRRTEVESVLVHSHLLAPERARREKRVRELLGPPGNGTPRPQGFLVVGTQTLEASIDYDVDLMVTDLAPADLIVQRAGRLLRHVRGVDEDDRPAGYRVPRLLITGVALRADDAPALPRGSVKVYGESALLRSLAVLLPAVAGVPLRIPADVPRLVREAYAPDAASPQNWEAAWDAAEATAARARQDSLKTAERHVISPPGEVSTLSGLIALGKTRAAEPDDRTGQAQVRNAEETLEVVVVQRKDGALYPMPGCGAPDEEPLPTELDAPRDDVARAIASCTLRLPAWVTNPRDFDDVLDDIEQMGSGLTGWQRSPWLRGELVLVLDESDGAYVTRTGRWVLTYDAVLGLTTQAADHTPPPNEEQAHAL